MYFWKSLVGKLWYTIILLVACVLMTLGVFLLPYIDINFSADESGEIKRMFVLVCIIGFSLTTFFALFLFTKITQPMQQLIQATNEIRKGNYGTRLSLVTSDEIGELASTFNHMADELEDTIRNLNHEKERVASVLRSMTDAVVSFDGEGRLISTNPPGAKVMSIWQGIDWNESDEKYTSQGQSFSNIQDVPPPLRPLFYAVVTEAQDQSAELHVKQSVWSIQMAPLHVEQGSRGAVAVLRDVTEEAHLEKMRSDFIANISHEIRTPLSMIQGYSEALLDGMAASPKESEELLQVIHDESLRMGRLVKDLLDLARMEAGHTDINLRRVDLNQMLDRVYRKFSVAAKEQGLILEYPHQDESLVLEAADEDKLEQVFTNLLDNAFRHTPSDKRIQIIAKQINASFIEIRIKDEGKGIPRDDLPFIFERFYKADKARVRDVGRGTGLGLAIVKHIVDAHQGTIEVDSIPGQGTEFRLIFPVQAALHHKA
ncbi:ATP-binding protein [Paenibacillus sp. 453mf]|uniref:ATP-binding protein n=1 Tax=Paenibacillus sp. 453mf TaxID=1761874 RepID=UPI0008E8C7A9|nr:ATP-binding protein [Paenibacillus sp. 453mf]SFS59558.1 two-component system, OmpR family, sensor histidine kinase ResE [Paenibacillus sp. 453mf]